MEDVLRAFLQPALDAPAHSPGGAFTLLRARLVFEPSQLRRDLLGKYFDESTKRFIEALAAGAARPEPRAALLAAALFARLDDLHDGRAGSGRIDGRRRIRFVKDSKRPRWMSWCALRRRRFAWSLRPMPNRQFF